MKYKNGLPKNFNSFTKEKQVIVLIESALEYPMEYKFAPLTKLHNIDEDLSNQILTVYDENVNTSNLETELNNFLSQCLVDKKNAVSLLNQ